MISSDHSTDMLPQKPVQNQFNNVPLCSNAGCEVVARLGMRGNKSAAIIRLSELHNDASVIKCAIKYK